MPCAFVALCCLSLGADPTDDALLTYRGELRAVENDDAAKHTFEWKLLIGPAADGAWNFRWVLRSQDQPGYPWIEQFGAVVGEPTRLAAAPPAIWHARADGASAAALAWPVLARAEPLALGQRWSHGGWDYEVAAPERPAEKAVWRVEGKRLYGRARAFEFAADSPFALAWRETLTLGQGQEHLLWCVLAKQEKPAPAAAARFAAAVDQAVALRERLGGKHPLTETRWNAEQRALLQAELPRLAAAAEGTPLDPVVKLASRDLAEQTTRAAALGLLEERRLGEPAPAFELTLETGAALANKDLRGVTVLHFWEYRDAPLLEPYGQAGYLDFLARRRQADGARVVGVAVDARFADPRERAKAAQAARRFKEFMNLSYPLAWDDGATLKRFGDPRPSGAKLPLFVVIDAQGKVAHYHAGLYETTPDRGLRELDEALTAAAAKRE